ncbi:MAG: methylated-DNA--[protein]-cysteine S-methyltransferase [Burkholderiaceae bacterium]
MKTATYPLLHRTPSPLGDILLAATTEGLCGLWFDGQKHMPDMTDWQPGHNAVIERARQQMQQYFARQRDTFDLPLDLSAGTPFQQAVWQALLAIPCGSHSSYGAIALRIRNPKAVRAVGAAVGRNPISVIVPCHRVLGASGDLTGYAGGLERKTALLEREGVLAAPQQATLV